MYTFASLDARSELAKALEKAGWAVDLDSNDLRQTAGKFEVQR